MIKLNDYRDEALLLGRLFYSSLFILSGYGKLMGFAGTAAYMERQGLPAANVFAALALIVELGGGLLILIGYQTRWVALGLAVFVLAAALIAHLNWADFNQWNNFLKNMAIVGGGLAFVAAGAGRYSMDGGRD